MFLWLCPGLLVQCDTQLPPSPPSPPPPDRTDVSASLPDLHTPFHSSSWSSSSFCLKLPLEGATLRLTKLLLNSLHLSCLCSSSALLLSSSLGVQTSDFRGDVGRGGAGDVDGRGGRRSLSRFRARAVVRLKAARAACQEDGWQSNWIKTKQNACSLLQ